MSGKASSFRTAFFDAFANVEIEIKAIASDFSKFGAIQRLEQIGKQVQPNAPVIPHHKIFGIATLPEARRKGIGSQLLKPILD
ncbi:GNAT family N-acetyltransferase (fragment) [Hyella patelloides LEGE 07179]|uniref:GNAT family N-acetyltransferase n=1 Tax=Hyella patelloides LEGE 07179 TaxID=945734 RepID=A0A563VQ22_9CYAN